jgi:hypothetical protein
VQDQLDEPDYELMPKLMATMMRVTVSPTEAKRRIRIGITLLGKITSG